MENIEFLKIFSNEKFSVSFFDNFLNILTLSPFEMKTDGGISCGLETLFLEKLIFIRCFVAQVVSQLFWALLGCSCREGNVIAGSGGSFGAILSEGGRVACSPVPLAEEAQPLGDVVLAHRFEACLWPALCPKAAL